MPIRPFWAGLHNKILAKEIKYINNDAENRDREADPIPTLN